MLGRERAGGEGGVGGGNLMAYDPPGRIRAYLFGSYSEGGIPLVVPAFQPPTFAEAVCYYSSHLGGKPPGNCATARPGWARRELGTKHRCVAQVRRSVMRGPPASP